MTRKEKETFEYIKRVERAFGQKQYMKSKTVPVYPATAEREFTRQLRKHMNPVQTAVATLLDKDKQKDGKIEKKASVSVFGKIKNAIHNAKLKKDIKKISDQVVAVSIRNIKKATDKTLGVPIEVPSGQFTETAMDWDDRAYQQIVNYLEAIGKKVEDASTPEQIEAILDSLRKGPKRLSRLAVTDLNGRVTELIQRYLGSDRYVWATARDDKVRPCHAFFDGKTFLWAEPPEIWELRDGKRVYTGRHCHPGQDYNCRCVAITVFEKKAILKFLKQLEEEYGKKKSRKKG